MVGCEADAQEDSLRAAEDAEAWSSSLPSDFSDSYISSLVSTVKNHRRFNTFMSMKASDEVFALGYDFGSVDARADLDEWFGFIGPIVAALATDPLQVAAGFEEGKDGSEGFEVASGLLEMVSNYTNFQTD